MDETTAFPSQAVFFDGPRGVAVFADLFGKAYVCWSEPKPIGAAVTFDVEYQEGPPVAPCLPAGMAGEGRTGMSEQMRAQQVAVKIIRSVPQAEVESIAHRLSPEEKLARGHWYEVTPE